MHDTHEHTAVTIKTLINWLAAVLGIGTFAGLVSVVVGMLSGAWIAVQLYGYLRYELPAKRARMAALQDGGEA